MKLRREGLFQALGITAYCALIAVFFNYGESILGDIPRFIGPIIMLLLFCTSVLVCGVLTFLKPYKLFVAGKTKEALEVVATTVIFLFSFLAIFFLGVLIF